MGYDLCRFEGDVDEELVCPICSCILEDPVQAPDCEHAFCNQCILEWLKHQPVCPIDRTTIHPKDLKPVPRILKNLLSKLRLKCDHQPYGCTSVVRLEMLASHLQECEYNPKKPVVCGVGCNLIIAKDELKSHNCVRELRKIIDDMQLKMGQMSSELTKSKMDQEILSAEFKAFKEFVSKNYKIAMMPSSLPSALPTTSSMTNLMSNLNATDEDEIARWSATLPLAKVTRWGGIISTPDAVLQGMTRRALVESHCPTNIINELMDNAHERHWPPGLNTLETRQLNRAHYSNFVCKRVPNKQAVLILACDNRHMSNHMIVEPGVILIFAHGVE